MSTLIAVLIILVSLLLILVVLVQNSKGGGLASSFASTNQVMGVRKTADVLEKATWTLAIILLALCLLSSAYTKPTTAGNTPTESTTKKGVQDIQPTAPLNNNVPAPAPTGPVPESQPTQQP